MDFGKIITRAWETLWNHKVLLWVGIFNGLLGLIDPDLTGWYSVTANSESSQYSGWLGFFREGNLDNLPFLVSSEFIMFVLFALLTGALSTFLFVMIIQGNLKDAEGVDKLSSRALFEFSKPFFWRLFGLRILLTIGGLALGLALVVLYLSVSSAAGNLEMVFGLLLCCGFVPLIYFLGIFIDQAQIAMVAEDLSFKSGFVRTTRLVTKQIGSYIVAALIISVINVGLGIIIIGSLIVEYPKASLLFMLNDNPDAVFQYIGGFIFWVLIPFVVLGLGGILEVYIQSAWVQTYLEARKKEVETKLPENSGSSPEVSG